MLTRVTICVLAIAVMAGCKSMYVGPRMGFDVPLSSSSSDPLITNESTPSSGVAGGVWYGVHLTENLSLETAPGVTSMERRIVRNGSYTENGVDVDLTAYQTMSTSILELPLSVRYAFASRTAAFVPYVVAGIGYHIARARRYQLNGTSRIADVEWPFYDENTVATGSVGRSSIAFMVGGGLQYPLSKTWHVRGDATITARTRALTAGSDRVLIGYDAFDTSMYYDFRSEFPLTSLILQVGIVGYF